MTATDCAARYEATLVPLAGLNDNQLDGIACAVCGVDFTADDAPPSVPVWLADDAGRVFVCVDTGGAA